MDTLAIIMILEVTVTISVSSESHLVTAMKNALRQRMQRTTLPAED